MPDILSAFMDCQVGASISYSGVDISTLTAFILAVQFPYNVQEVKDQGRTTKMVQQRLVKRLNAGDAFYDDHT